MYQVTKAVLDTLSLPELFKVRDAIQVMTGLDVWEMNADVRQHVTELIAKREKLRQ